MTLLLALLALPTPPGWKASGDLESYDTRAAIYQAIDGAADFYFAYGLEQMQTREYSRSDLDVEVELYELGDPLDAFGVFERERPRAGTPVKLGAAAVVTAQLCLVRHGRFYLKAKAFRGELGATACRELIAPVVATLGDAAESTELGLLPTRDRIAGSVGFARERYLGLSALERCVHADYKTGDDEYRVFVMVGGRWETFETWQPVPDQRLPVMRREIPYTGWVAVAKTERGIIGVVTAKEEAVVARLRQVLAAL